MKLSPKSAMWVSASHFILSMAVLLLWFNLYWRDSAPVVLIDELLFSYVAVVDPSLSPYSNSVFSFIYSSASLCGADFLVCGRGINLIFWSMIVLMVSAGIYWTKNLAVAIFAFFVSTSSVSFFIVSFLPEVTYYFFVILALTLLAIAWSSAQRHLLLLVASGVVFGLAMLVKPHSLFVLVIAMAAQLIVGLLRKNDLRRLSIGLGVLSLVPLATRVLIEVFRGSNNPFALFGNYLGGSGDELPAFQDDLPIATPPDVVPTGSELFSSSALISGVVPYLSAALFLYLPPLIFILQREWRRRNTTVVSAPTLEESLVWLFSLASTGMLVMGYLFGAYVTANGDDHSTRVLLRYSEYLVPFTWVAVIMLVARENSPSLSRRALVAPVGSVVLGAMFVAFGGMSGITLSTTDSLLLYSTSTWAGWFFAIVIGLSSVFVAANGASPKFLVVASSIATVGLVISSYSLINQQSSFHRAEADGWNMFLEELGGEVADEDVIFIASSRPSAVSPMLMGGKFESAYALVNGYSSIPGEWLSNYEYAYVNSEIYPPKSSSEIATYGNSTLYKLNSSPSLEEDIFRSSPMVSRFSNIGVVTPWGYWVDGTTSTIDFREMIPAGKTISIQIIRHQLTELTDISLTVNDETPIVIDVPAAGTIFEIDLLVGENGATSLELSYQDSFEVGYVEGMSTYSFGIGKVTVVE